jgi:hypothetical protein
VLTEPLLLEQPLNDSPVDTPLVPEPLVAPLPPVNEAVHVAPTMSGESVSTTRAAVTALGPPFTTCTV